MSGAGERPRAGDAGQAFYKLTGSGNDFVFFDARAGSDGRVDADLEALRTPEAIAAVCDRRNGVGADGVVFLERAAPGSVQIAYYNRDGSRAELCGNATLCTARLAAMLGAVPAAAGEFSIQTDAGAIVARVPAVGDPEIGLGPIRDVVLDAELPLGRGERRIGYARVGVPHLVVLADDAGAVDLDRRGAALRRATRDRPEGANVNFVSRSGDRWAMRTFERGVEGETLACGTGAVASATLVARWTGAANPVVLMTASGRPVHVTVPEDAGRTAVLAGEGRLVFSGDLRVLRGADPIG